jgi:8-oxo-dGTP diphosphatase
MYVLVVKKCTNRTERYFAGFAVFNQIFIYLKRIKYISNPYVLMSKREVACGVLYNKEGKILMGLRALGSPYAGFWEFPGGQLEENETIEECLHREWMEELNLCISIDREIHQAKYDNYYCRFFAGKIVDEENVKRYVHEDIKFLDIEEIKKLKLFDGDLAVLDAL